MIGSGSLIASSERSSITVDGLRERQHLLDSTTSVYTWRRWYVVLHSTLVVGLAMFSQIVYNTVAVSLQLLFGWDAMTFELFQIWTFVTFFLAFVPILWTMNRFGVRVYLVIVTMFMLPASLMRCFSAPTFAITIITHVSVIIAGAVQAGAFLFPIMVAGSYFPENEWNLAISINVMAPQFGVAIAYCVAAFIMPSPDPTAKTAPPGTRQVFFGTNYAILGVSVLLCLGLLFYPKRRVESANVGSDSGVRDIVQQCKMLLRCRTFYLAVARFMLVSINMALMGIWPLYLETKDLPQVTTGRVLVITGVLMVFGSAGSGYIADRMELRKVKYIFIAVSVAYFFSSLGLLYSKNAILTIASVSVAQVSTGSVWGVTFSVAGIQFGSAGVAAGGWIMFGASALSIVFFVITSVLNVRATSLAWVDYYQVATSFFGFFVTLAYSTERIPMFFAKRVTHDQ